MQFIFTNLTGCSCSAPCFLSTYISVLSSPPRPLTIAEKTSVRLCTFSPPIPHPPHLVISHSAPRGQLTFHRLQEDFNWPTQVHVFSLFSQCCVPLSPDIWPLPNSQEGRWSVLLTTVNHPHLSLGLRISALSHCLWRKWLHLCFLFRLAHCMIRTWVDVSEYARFTPSAHTQNPAVYVSLFRHKHKKQGVRQTIFALLIKSVETLCSSRNAFFLLLWPFECVSPGMQVKCFVSQWNSEQG